MDDATAFPERWLPIPGYVGYYEASDLGRIRSMGRRSRGGTIWGEPFILKPRLRRDNKYRTVDLYRDGDRKPRKVHLIIAEVFLGERPSGMEVCHRNDDKSDNRAENLYHGTHADNMRDTVDNGLHPQAGKAFCVNNHEFTPENTYWRPTGGRACKECGRAASRRYAARLAA